MNTNLKNILAVIAGFIGGSIVNMAFLAAKISENHHMKLALLVGCLFLAGGFANVLMLPSPAWFTVVDLAGACIPMAYLGGKWASGKPDKS